MKPQSNLRLIVLFCLVCFGCGQAHASIDVEIRVAPDALSLQSQYLGGISVEKLTEYNQPNVEEGRLLIDFILLQQALLLGGCRCHISFVPVASSYQRSLKLLSTDRLRINAETFWLVDLKKQQKVWVSQAVLQSGEIEAGLYTAVNNHKALSVKANQLSQLSLVSNRNWTTDWQLANKLGFASVEHTTFWSEMVRVVDAKLIDVMISEFSQEPDLALQWKKHTLVPIPNLKLLFRDSRHYAFSQRHKQSKRIHRALNRGLLKLKKQGRLKKAYQAIGLINPLVKDWRVIN